MNNHKWQVLILGVSIVITAFMAFILTKLSNDKHTFPLIIQLGLWCITGFTIVLAIMNSIIFYQGKRWKHQKENQKKKAVKDFYRYYELQNPPEMNT